MDNLLYHLNNEYGSPFFETAAKHLKGCGSTADILLHEEFRFIAKKQNKKNAFSGYDAPCGPQLTNDCGGWSGAVAHSYLSALNAVDSSSVYEEASIDSILLLAKHVGGRFDSFHAGVTGAEVVSSLLKYGASDASTIGPHSLDLRKRLQENGVEDLLLQPRKHLVKQAALITCFEHARDAIASRSSVVLAGSQQGFKRIRDVQGFGVPGELKRHMVVFVSAISGSRPGLLCLDWVGNAYFSGGVSHTQPLNSVWVDADICNKMFAWRDSWALSRNRGYIAIPSPFLGGL